MSHSLFYAELPWPETERRVRAGAPVFLPLGATEQHGRHMALNTDVVLPTSIATRVARRVDGLACPPWPTETGRSRRLEAAPRFPAH